MEQQLVVDTNTSHNPTAYFKAFHLETSAIQQITHPSTHPFTTSFSETNYFLNDRPIYP